MAEIKSVPQTSSNNIVNIDGYPDDYFLEKAEIKPWQVEDIYEGEEPTQRFTQLPISGITKVVENTPIYPSKGE